MIDVHGGPNWLSLITWSPFIQHMVSRGWVVLSPNYRGSTGYGKAWQLASRYDLGGVDTQDVVAGANYLEAQEYAIPDKIAVTGRSWGGYLTMTCLTQYPERWAAGSASSTISSSADSSGAAASTSTSTVTIFSTCFT